MQSLLKTLLTPSQRRQTKPPVPSSTYLRSQDDNRRPTLLARHLPRKRSHAPHRSISLPRGQLRRPRRGRETQDRGTEGEDVDHPGAWLLEFGHTRGRDSKGAHGEGTK
jgi:hypothetical protein